MILRCMTLSCGFHNILCIYVRVYIYMIYIYMIYIYIYEIYIYIIYIYIYVYKYIMIYYIISMNISDVYFTIELLIAVVHSKFSGILQQRAPPFERSMS